MGLFHRKRVSEKVQKDKELVSENERSIDALVVLAEQAGNDSLVNELTQIKEQIKYIIAVENDKVYDYDKKIKNLIGDMRIVMVKNDKETDEKAQKALVQIKLAIADRNANV